MICCFFIFVFLKLKTKIETQQERTRLRVDGAVDAVAAAADFGVVAGVFGERQQVVAAYVNPRLLQADFARNGTRQRVAHLHRLYAEIVAALQMKIGRVGEILILVFRR